MAFTMRIVDREDAAATSPEKTCDNCLGGCAGGCVACNCTCDVTVDVVAETDSAPLSPLEA